MRDIVITAAGALLSLVILVYLVSPRQPGIPLSRPNTEDRGEHGLRAVHDWLAAGDINVRSLRRPWTALDENGLPGQGNLLITSLPLLREPLDGEWRALNQWLEQGNSILLLASIYHVPEWSQQTVTRDAVSRLTAEEFSLGQQRRTDEIEDIGLDEVRLQVESFMPSQVSLEPLSRHPLFDGVEQISSLQTEGLFSYRDSAKETRFNFRYIDSNSSRMGLRLLQAEHPGQTAMWLLPTQQGWLYLSAYTDLVSNGVLAKGDNARWIDNLVNITVRPQAAVIFDDYHFGLSELYDPEAFFADQRFHNTLLFIGGFWLVYAFGRSPRLAPVHNRRRRHRARDFVEAMAGFYTRRLHKRALLKALAGNAVQSVSKHTRLDGESMWNWMSDHPDISPQDIERLQRALGIRAGRVKLFQLSQSIHRIHKVLI